jgi:hypothetical protein
MPAVEDYWRWEHSALPFPARRMVIPAATRVWLNRFLNYAVCPAGEGNQRSHRRKHLVHVILADTGRVLCIGEGAVFDMERSAAFIRSYAEIPDGRWVPIAVHPGGGR